MLIWKMAEGLGEVDRIIILKFVYVGEYTTAQGYASASWHVHAPR